MPRWEVLGLLLFGAVLVALYVRHALRTEYPIIDLSLLKVPTFRTSVTGGSLFRIGVGAVPLLLPLMLQLGFGMSPLRSGLTTFVAAIGAMAMKATAAPILDAIGFRRVLVLNGVIGAVFIAANSQFSPATPIVLILAVLLVGGYFRSLEFTCINAIAYADIDNGRMSRAVSFAAVAQQLSLSVGVAFGAGVVQVLHARHGGALSLSDFHWAFVAVAGVSATAVVAFARLPADAGASLASRPAVRTATGAQGEIKINEATARGAEPRPGSAMG